MELPTINENPKGLHQRYVIRKVVGETKREGFFGTTRLKTKAVDDNAEYFVMRLDRGGKDPIHIEACREAVLYYAELIKDHIPELSQDLIKRYGSGTKKYPF